MMISNGNEMEGQMNKLYIDIELMQWFIMNESDFDS